ncbi:MAG TPA: alpha/beta hydrolase [Dongiaceae bacterium]|nr:alpha/beta hydrolase [Dongiaceae bacterium]
MLSGPPRAARATAAFALGAALLTGAAGFTPPPPSAGRYLQTHGIRMYYELHGRGSPLLLLHGGCGNGMQFEKQLPSFSTRYRCIVPDCCAQGRTSDRPGPLTYHAMAEDMIALLDRLRITRVDIMGWSDGGNIGLDMAMHHPARVQHLVTFGANFRPDGLNPQDVEWNNSATAESFGDGVREGWTKLNPQPGHYEEAMNKIIAMWRTLPHWTAADLARIRAKCMICAGDHDLIRPEHTEALAKAIPGATMWIVPNASHGAMLERPELVNPKVLEFLAH